MVQCDVISAMSKKLIGVTESATFKVNKGNSKNSRECKHSFGNSSVSKVNNDEISMSMPILCVIQTV